MDARRTTATSKGEAKKGRPAREGESRIEARVDLT